MNITFICFSWPHSVLSVTSFSTKAPIITFSSLTARGQQWRSFVHYKLLVIRIVSPLTPEAISLRCLRLQIWATLTLLWSSTQAVSSSVLNKPSAYAAAQLQLSMLLLALVFPTCHPNPLLHHHLPLPPTSPFQPFRKDYKTSACVFLIVPETWLAPEIPPCAA